MNIPRPVLILLAQANLHESSQNYGLAEKALLEAITIIKDGDRGLIGTLHVNLGLNAMADSRPDDAIRFFREACDLLKDQKGDGFLQRAHAHYNLALLLYDRDDKDTSGMAKEAMRLYIQYPFSSVVDIADATSLFVCASAFIDRHVSEHSLRDAWGKISKADLNDLYQATALPCLNILAKIIGADVEEYLGRYGSSSSSLMHQYLENDLRERVTQAIIDVME